MEAIEQIIQAMNTIANQFLAINVDDLTDLEQDIFAILKRLGYLTLDENNVIITHKK